MVLSTLIDVDSLLLLMVTFSGAVVLSRNSTHDDFMSNDQGHKDNDVPKGGCPNWQGLLVSDGEKYVPSGNDMCMQCTCDQGFPVLCHSVACSPPLQCSNPQQVKEACCEYICLDDKAPKDRNVTDIHGNTDKDDGENITNLSLRLIASTVTSFLVLALLLFMVHRLRQRRLLLAMRRFEAQSHQGQTDDTDSEQYIPDGFMSVECPPYTDPPPPYSPPKPPHILPGEQPPPYDEISHNNVTHADENRNQIQVVNSSSGSGHAVRNNFAAHRRTGTRNNAQGDCNVAGRVDPQGRPYDTGHEQGDGGDNLRPPNTLPAYASTDVVEGLGVVISPGSDMVCYSSSWHTWIGAHAGRQVVQSEARQQRSPHRGQVNTSYTPNGSRVHAVPTATAFQRFSNIFRRDSWKMKNWRRPVSEYSMSPHYATVPRNEQSPRARAGNANSQPVVKNVSSRPYSSGFPDTLCLSFDTGQATYTLGAVSPSTSSSNSSEQYEQHTNASTTIGSTTSTTTPGASSSGNSISPPDRSVLHVDDFRLNPIHRQQFHDDLCRHLPPLQLSASDQANPAHRDTTCVSSSQPSSTEGTLNNAFAFQCSTGSDASVNIPHTSGHSFRGAISTREASLPAARPLPSHATPELILTSSTSSSSAHHRNEPKKSLAAFIRSNPVSSSSSDSRDHAAASVVSLQSFQSSSCPIAHPAPGECSDVLNSSCSQAIPQFFSPMQQRNSVVNNKETQAGVQNVKDGQGGTAQDAACKLEVLNLQRRNNEQSEAALDQIGSLPQEFQDPYQVIFPFSSNLTSVTSAVVYNTPLMASYISIPNLLTAAPASATSSTSPSPSPPPTVCAYSLGALRRSQSGASQASMFSVCSETGEKKLKSGDLFENDRMVSEDSSYPDNYSLSRTRSGQCQQPVASGRSLPPLVDAPGLCMPGAHEEVTLSNPGSFNELYDPRCLQRITFSSQYPQPGATLSIENSDAASLGLVTTAAFPCNINSTSSHPQSISNSSIFSSCADNLTYPSDVLQQGDTWQGSSYNFNSLADVDKNLAGKDVPLLYEGDRMTQSVNIPPIPPFITAQSGKTLMMPVQDDPSNLGKSGKNHDVLKKMKKKRVKDKNCSGPQCGTVSRHTSSSPKHHCVIKNSEKSKDGSPIHKSDGAVKEKDVVALRVARPVDKKHRGHSGVSRQHVRLCDNLNCNKVMSRSTGDATTVYGNADVYRSVAGEGLAQASSYQHQVYGPWSHQSVSCGCDQTFFPSSAINDLNQPPSCLKTTDNSSSPSHLVATGPDGAVQVKGDARRKNGHRRQSSTGEKACHISSPSRYKSRPKSLATPEMHGSEKRAEVNLPRLLLATSEFGMAGKGARSGFGHDLNFDDQSGLADLHILETECGSRRFSIGQDGHIQPAVAAARKLSRGEGNCEALNIPKGSGSSSNGYHPGSRSGLSNELSFTSRPALNSSHNRKRQSLPTGVGSSPLTGTQDRTNLNPGVAARPKPSEDSHINIIPIRGDRRVDKAVFVDDCIEATSYV